MGSVSRRFGRRKSLSQELEEARQRRNKKPKPKADDVDRSRGKLRCSNCGPNGARREHPLIEGIQWLRFFGEALVMHGIAFAARVSVERWEHDECLSLYLQRVVHAEAHAPAIRMVGGKVIQERKIPVGGGMWEHWRIPIPAVNGKDTRWVLRTVLGPKEADLVFASNAPIRAMHNV